jgi:hypothetical protein
MDAQRFSLFEAAMGGRCRCDHFGIALIWGGCTAAFNVLYVNGIVSEGSGEYDRRPGETDGVGMLLDELRGPRAG